MFVDYNGDDWYVDNNSGDYEWFEGNDKHDGFTGVGSYKVTYNRDGNTLSIYKGSESTFVETIDMNTDEFGKYKSERAAKFALISA